jgi:hypothetical protein
LSRLGSGYRACGELRYIPNQVGIDSQTLSVRGRIIDTVGVRALWNSKYLIEGSFAMGLEALTKEKLLAVVRDLYKRSGAEAPGDEVRLYNRAARVALAYDSTRDEWLCNWDSEIEQVIQEAWDSHQRGSARLESHGSNRIGTQTVGVQLVDYEAEMFSYIPEREDARRVRLEQGARLRKLRSMSQRVGRRSLCLTQKSLLGMVPWISKAGDVICILHGSSVPVVLRKSENRWDERYSVIGQCYLEGWMLGGQVTWAEHEADTFELE